VARVLWWRVVEEKKEIKVRWKAEKKQDKTWNEAVDPIANRGGSLRTLGTSGTMRKAVTKRKRSQAMKRPFRK
jgi:hypothetical protein